MGRWWFIPLFLQKKIIVATFCTHILLSIFRDDLKRWKCNMKTEISKREQDQRTQTIFLGGIADSTADRPKAGSSVFIMVSLQIIHIFLYFFAAHMLIKLAFPCCFWLQDGEKHLERCVVGGQTNAWWHTYKRTTYYLVSRVSATELLFLPELYICRFWFQLSKCCERKTLIWDVWTSSDSSLWFRGLWKVFVFVLHISVNLCLGQMDLCDRLDRYYNLLLHWALNCMVSVNLIHPFLDANLLKSTKHSKPQCSENVLPQLGISWHCKKSNILILTLCKKRTKL